ncbi:MAG TPA: LysR substrate-binding domain-containing protein [Inquilinus sp.]
MARSEICIEDLKGEKIISFSRQNLSFTERCFAEKFEAHDLAKSVAYTCDDTFSVVSLVSAGLGIGFAPEWTLDLPNRNFELRSKLLGRGSERGSQGRGLENLVVCDPSIKRSGLPGLGLPDPGRRRDADPPRRGF